jgi:GT2 family glycosyltransferase
VVVFTDIRNRARPGWLAGLLDALAADGVAIAGGEVEIGGDRRLAHRLARRYSHVDPHGSIDDPFLPFVTTSSMAVRRSVLEAVGGFAERRSGADAELCWAAQLDGHGRVVIAGDSHMDCEPRGTVREVIRQWRRYAWSYVDLRERFAAQGARIERRLGVRPFVALVRQPVRRLVRGPERDPALEAVDALRWLGYEIDLRRAIRKARRPG